MTCDHCEREGRRHRCVECRGLFCHACLNRERPRRCHRCDVDREFRLRTRRPKLTSAQARWLQRLTLKVPGSGPGVEVRGHGVRPLYALMRLKLVRIEDVGTPWTKGWWQRASITDAGRDYLAGRG